MRLIDRYPELKRVPTSKERDDIHREAWRRCGNNLVVVGSMLVTTVILIPTALYFNSYLSELFPSIDDGLAEFITLPIVIVLSYLLFFGLGKRPLHRAIRQIMTERGFPTCVQCGYNLTGVESPRCPECGQPFAPGSNTNPKD